MANFSMLSSIWTKIGDILSGFFAIIPQTMYFIYTSMASLLDMFQFVFRKLAGLDVYYVNGTEKSGDIIVQFIEGILGINNHYSALTTVFWSLVIFGVIVLVLMTIFTIIKAHYNYDAKKSSPSYIIKNTIKALATMAIIPACTLFGLYLGTALFRALDTITTQASSSQLGEYFEGDAIANLAYSTAEQDEKEGQGRRYAGYDFFGAREWSNTQTFTGIMFEACSSSANRVRYGSYTAGSAKTDTDEETGDTTITDFGVGSWDNAGIFYTTRNANSQEWVAKQIDYAFANNLALANPHTIRVAGLEEASIAIGSSLTYGPSAGFSFGLINVKSFSKYNVGLVWYYYNLWSFNFILAFAGIVICLTLFTNVLFGMFMRIIISAVLFMIFPPIVGITPFDEGNAVKSWRKEFISYITSAYAAVAAMNIFFLLLPAFNAISFFNNALLDGICSMLIIMAGLTVIKRFISIVSNFVGAKNLDEIGAGIKKEAASPVMKGLATTVSLGTGALKVAKFPKRTVERFAGSHTGKKVARGLDNLGTKIKGSKVANKLKNSKFGGWAAQKKTNAKTKMANVKTSVKNFGGKLYGAGQKGATAVNKLLDKTPVKLGLSMLGIPVDTHLESEYKEYVDDEGKTKIGRVVGHDEDGKAIYEEKKSGLGIIKNAFVDFSKVTLTAAKDITGLKGIFDKIDKDTDTFSDLRGAANDIIKEAYQAVRAAGSYKPPFKTKKMKKKEEEEEQINETILNLNANETASRVALKKIEDIVDNF